ncbi:hypothetical protein T05_10028 [Trichinella murrelli]|uniref:Uncharacterized protein n=1 Tax=Trichinella murrelli TaxID=144512 RepID=A0A0V0TCG5_9BILA|nr:hypothetical protein T05_10028 [Trichinella murrelli]
MKIRHDYARCSAASGVGGTDLRVGVAAVLGLASYYRKFVKGFANVAALLGCWKKGPSGTGQKPVSPLLTQ